MAEHFADRLTEAIKRKGTPACVGFDPVFSRLPAAIGAQWQKAQFDSVDASMAVQDFGVRLLEVVAPMVSVVKINIAFLEPFGFTGTSTYHTLVRAAQDLGLIVIGDIKRGDIGHSSSAYADAHVGNGYGGEDYTSADAVTIHTYLGSDGVEPFINVAQPRGRGVFALVHTSNDSAGQIQHLVTEGGRTVAERVAELVQQWATQDGRVGACGYSCLGAVVAPCEIEMARRLRALMPNVFFLIPGFGAQGRSVDQVKACFKPDGTGAIVNSSRSVIYAHEGKTGDWRLHVKDACKEFAATAAAMCKA